MQLSTDEVTIDIRQNKGTIAFPKGRTVDAVVIHPGSNTLHTPLMIDETWSYFKDFAIAIGVDKKGLLVAFLGSRENKVSDLSFSNSDSADAYNFGHPYDSPYTGSFIVDNSNHPEVGLDVSQTVPLKALSIDCPIVQGDQISLSKACVGNIGDWKMTVFTIIDHNLTQDQGEEFLELDALLQSGSVVCFAAVSITLDDGATPVSVLASCIGGSFPSDLTSLPASYTQTL